MTSSINYYHVLGLPDFASEEDVKREFRKLAVKLHPDKPDGSHEKFKLIVKAKETLLDGSKRYQHDRELKHKIKNEEKTKTQQNGNEPSKGDLLFQSYKKQCEDRRKKKRKWWNRSLSRSSERLERVINKKSKTTSRSSSHDRRSKRSKSGEMESSNKSSMSCSGTAKPLSTDTTVALPNKQQELIDKLKEKVALYVRKKEEKRQAKRRRRRQEERENRVHCRWHGPKKTIQRRPGDWKCPGCGIYVFATKIECIKCGAKKHSDANGGWGPTPNW